MCAYLNILETLFLTLSMSKSRILTPRFWCQAKFEHYVLGTEDEYKIEARLVNCMQRLAQVSQVLGRVFAIFQMFQRVLVLFYNVTKAFVCVTMNLWVLWRHYYPLSLYLKTEYWLRDSDVSLLVACEVLQQPNLLYFGRAMLLAVLRLSLQYDSFNIKGPLYRCQADRTDLQSWQPLKKHPRKAAELKTMEPQQKSRALQNLKGKSVKQA